MWIRPRWGQQGKDLSVYNSSFLICYHIRRWTDKN